MQAVGNLEPLTIAFPKFHEFQRAKKGVLFTVFLRLRPCLNGKILVSCITGNGGLKICARCSILATVCRISDTRVRAALTDHAHTADASSQAPKALYTATPRCLGPNGLQLASSSTSPRNHPKRQSKQARSCVYSRDNEASHLSTFKQNRVKALDATNENISDPQQGQDTHLLQQSAHARQYYKNWT